MILSSRRSLRLALLMISISALSLSACATNSDGDNTSNGGERAERPSRSSGVFVQPVALLFADMDGNPDKVTSKAEMLAGVKEEWSRFERNPSATALASWSSKTLGSTDANPTFLSFDRDFNGVITEAEFTSRIDALFARFDKNVDGAVDRSELVTIFAAPIGRGQNRGQRGGDAGQRGQRGQGGRGGRGGGGGGGGRPTR